MTLNEAIEILQELERHSSLAFSPDELDSIKLGIEALKSVRAGRKVGLHYEAKLLPGETEE